TQYLVKIESLHVNGSAGGGTVALTKLFQWHQAGRQQDIIFNCTPTFDGSPGKILMEITDMNQLPIENGRYFTACFIVEVVAGAIVGMDKHQVFGSGCG